MDWVSDGLLLHAVRESDGDHRSCLCGKYVFSRVAKVGVRCRECEARATNPAVGVSGKPPAAAVLRGRGIQGNRLNGKLMGPDS